MKRKKTKRRLRGALGIGAALGLTNEMFKPSSKVRNINEIDNVAKARKKRQEEKERKERRKAGR